MNLQPLILLVFILPVPVPTEARAFADNVIKAEAYLLRNFNPELGLIYESDDQGTHWLRGEFPEFSWGYNQTYWLYSDNLFAYLALRRHHPQVSRRIREAIETYGQPPSGLFEVVGAERVRLPFHDALDFIVEKSPNHVVVIRRHNSTFFVLGNYVDFWMYEALEFALEGKLDNAAFLLRRAEVLWRGNGLWDWSFTVHDQMFSNQKLALLLFTARAVGYPLTNRDRMERHLWSMQNDDGGVASLSDPRGVKTGSSNVETTALSVLIYDEDLTSKFPRLLASGEPGNSFALLLLASLLMVCGIFLSWRGFTRWMVRRVKLKS